MIIMPEQQKVDETIESANITDKKIPKKLENSSIALEKGEIEGEDLNSASESDNNDLLESDTEDLKEI